MESIKITRRIFLTFSRHLTSTRTITTKTHAPPLKIGENTFLLNPKYTTQSDKTQFRTFPWSGACKVMKILSHSNYTVSKTGTHKTQCVHRKRLRKFIPYENFPDIQVEKSHFYTDPNVIDELEAPQSTTTSAAVSSDTGESDHGNLEGNFQSSPTKNIATNR